MILKGLYQDALDKGQCSRYVYRCLNETTDTVKSIFIIYQMTDDIDSQMNDWKYIEEVQNNIFYLNSPSLIKIIIGID